MKAAATRSIQRRLSALDASYLYNESAANPLHVGVVLIFEGLIAFDRIVRSIEQRIHLLPRFRQRLAEVPFDIGFPTWEDDPDFDLKNHLKRFELPPGIGQQQAIREMLREYHPVLDRARPLWKFLCFERWPGERTAMVCKIHHALADGSSGVRLVKKLFDFSPRATPPEPPAERTPTAPLPSLSQRLVSAAQDLARGQLTFFSDAMVEASNDPAALFERHRQLYDAVAKIAGPRDRQIVGTPWNTLPLSGSRDLVWFSGSFNDYRTIREVFGGSSADVLLTIVTEAAGRYLKHHGYLTDGWFRIGWPVSVRQREERTDYGNRVAMTFPTIPACPMDPIQRLRIVCREMRRIKPEEIQAMDRLGLRWTGVLGSSLGRFPTGVFTSALLNEMTLPSLSALGSRTDVLRMNSASAFMKATDSLLCRPSLTTRRPEISFVASHVTSAQAPAYLCGHQCVQQIGILPICEHLGYSVLMLSYNQTRCIGMSADQGVMPDLDRMRHYAVTTFNELKIAAAKQRADGNSERRLYATDTRH